MIIAEGGSGTVSISGTGDLAVQGNLWMGTLSSGTGTLAIAGSTAAISVTGDLNLHSFATSSTRLELLADANGVSPVVVSGNVILNDAALAVDMTACDPSLTVVVVDNRGLNPVAGTFLGLAEGATVADSADRMITYAGGDGNDVVLVSTSSPGTVLIVR